MTKNDEELLIENARLKRVIKQQFKHFEKVQIQLDAHNQQMKQLEKKDMEFKDTVGTLFCTISGATLGAGCGYGLQSAVIVSVRVGVCTGIGFVAGGLFGLGLWKSILREKPNLGTTGAE